MRFRVYKDWGVWWVTCGGQFEAVALSWVHAMRCVDDLT